MDLRGRIVQLRNSINSFSLANGILHFDEKPTYDFITQNFPFMSMNERANFVKLIHELNDCTNPEQLLSNFETYGLSVPFSILSAKITSQIDENGTSPRNTPAKLINAVLIVESYNTAQKINSQADTTYERNFQ